MEEETAPTALNEPARNLVLGTAGHIDHGKSSLVLALTGTDPDRLKEEKRRGITIELGFARLELPDGSSVGVVDVPGHERFVRQMIAGSTGIDFALLCIAADDGIMPQTVEHLQVIELLGIRTLIIALTKTDLVDDDWRAFIEEEVRSSLQETPYAQAPIVSTSIKDPNSIDNLKRVIADLASTIHHTERSGNARLPIDRSFTIKGSGTVVTGTLWSGTVSSGDELELLPTKTRVRVRSVQEHNKPVETAYAGNRTALNLSAIGTDEVRPGMMLATPDTITPSDRFDARLLYLGSESKTRLKSGTRVRVNHGTTEVEGRVLLMDGVDEAAPREAVFAQIRLDEELPLTRSDRFIIRSMTPVQVIGGGEVLLAHPRRRTTLSKEEHELLQSLLQEDEAAACDAAFSLVPCPTTADEVARISGLSPAACSERLEKRAAQGEIVRLLSDSKKSYFLTKARLQSLTGAVENALLKFHSGNPNERGISLSALHRDIDDKISTSAFDALLLYLESTGRIVLESGRAAHPKAGAGARQKEQQISAVLIERIRAAGNTPPTADSLIADGGVDDSLVRRALNTLDKNGSIVKVGDYCFSTEAFQSAWNAARIYLEKQGSASATELKEAMTTSRKYAIPLLECFDEQGLTRREGDMRVLNERR